MFKGLEVSVGLPPSLPGVVSQLEQDRPYTIRTIGQNQTCSFTLTLIHKKHIASKARVASILTCQIRITCALVHLRIVFAEGEMLASSAVNSLCPHEAAEDRTGSQREGQLIQGKGIASVTLSPQWADSLSAAPLQRNESWHYGFCYDVELCPDTG